MSVELTAEDKLWQAEGELARAERKIRKLMSRLAGATKIAESCFLSSWQNMPAEFVGQIKAAGALGYSVHATVDGSGNVQIKAFKREGA